MSSARAKWLFLYRFGDEFPFSKTLIFHVTSVANKILVGFLELPANKYGKTRNSGIDLTTNGITAEYYMFGSNFLPGLKIIK